jgi:hypothetical protein
VSEAARSRPRPRPARQRRLRSLAHAERATPQRWLPLSRRERVARQRRVRVGACREVSRSGFCRSELARDRLASLAFCWDQELDQELSSRPSGASSYFSLLAQREVTKRKGTPRRSPSGILPPGARSGYAGSRTAHPALRERAHIRVRAPAGLVLRPPADRQGAPLRGHRGRAGLAAHRQQHEHALARGAAPQQRRRHGAQFPCVAPSNAADFGGKAWMFERMDARVHAGPKSASSAGHGAREASDARQSGRLLFGYFLLARQEKVTRAGRRPDRKRLLRLLNINSSNTSNRSKTTPAGRGHGPLLQQRRVHHVQGKGMHPGREQARSYTHRLRTHAACAARTSAPTPRPASPSHSPGCHPDE